MKKLLKPSLLTFVLMISSFVFAQEAKKEKYETVDISMFPKAETGTKQIVLKLPIQPNEKNLKVEIFVGNEQLVDCNSQSMVGNVKNETLAGYQYPYYKIESSGLVRTTLMACPDNKKTNAFVSMQPFLLPYNSRLPHIFYVPEKLEVRYRIWRADAKMQKIQ